MRDISELGKCFDKYIFDLKQNIKDALDETTTKMYEDAKERIELPAEARNIQQFVEYENSLQRSEVKEVGDECSASVFSDLVVHDGSKWDGVPIGAFLEWGTGPLGEGSNTFEHGYPYTTESPWDAHTSIQWEQTGTWGIEARPHLYPALIAGKNTLVETLKEKTKETWNK